RMNGSDRMGDGKYLNKIFGLLGEKAGRPTNENGKIAWGFLNSLQELIRDETGILKNAKFMHAGSAYEGLSVNAEADFDIPLILSGPGRIFVRENFEIYREEQSKQFLLKWKENIHSEYRYKYNSNGFLHSKALLNDAFERLEFLISELSDWKVEAKRGLVSLVLTIYSQFGSKRISMDLVTQISFSHWECPDIVPLHRLPESLQRYVVKLQRNGSSIFFASLTVPKPQSAELCSIAFSMLEKKFLVEDVNVRDIVRLVKLIAECRNWKKKYSLKSFQLKHLAIKHVEKLIGIPIWEGVKLLLNYIYNDLQDNTIKDFFIKNQVIYPGKPTKVNDIHREIHEVMKWSPNDLYKEAERLYEREEDEHTGLQTWTPYRGTTAHSHRTQEWLHPSNSANMAAYDREEEEGSGLSTMTKVGIGAGVAVGVAAIAALAAASK
ncbi:unnamed protein product, partial [Meganyctiphanes norvegica]